MIRGLPSRGGDSLLLEVFKHKLEDLWTSFRGVEISSHIEWPSKITNSPFQFWDSMILSKIYRL